LPGPFHVPDRPKGRIQHSLAAFARSGPISIHTHSSLSSPQSPTSPEREPLPSALSKSAFKLEKCDLEPPTAFASKTKKKLGGAFCMAVGFISTDVWLRGEIRQQSEALLSSDVWVSQAR
jgi:hypothetical protein